MTALHSFWSLPFISSNNNCGWLDKKYFYYSWVFSCLQIKKNYSSFNLHTDNLGKKIFIDTLKLPYDDVILSLNKIPKQDNIFWSISKLHVFSEQKEPFIHFDGDVFIWKPLLNLHNYALFAQNLEIDLSYNNLAYDHVISQCDFIPHFFQDLKNQGINSCNFGIIGGNDYEYFNYYSRLSLNFIERNSNILKNAHISLVALTYEQIFFYYLSIKENKKIEYLFEDNNSYNWYIKDIYTNPNKISYFHPYGEFKKKRINCMLIENFLSSLYPDTYEYVNKLLRDKII